LQTTLSAFENDDSDERSLELRPIGVNFINVLGACFSYKILAPKITKPNVTREKLPKRLTYKKGARKTLMK